MPRPATRRALAALRPEETATMLEQLLSRHVDLELETVAIAEALLDQVDLVNVADQVEDCFRGLDIDDLYAGAGRSLRGYVDPTEALWRSLEAQLAPFLEDIRRRVVLGLEEAALKCCQGIVLGLYRVDQGPPCDAVRHAPDWASEAAGEAVHTWRTTRRPRRVGPKHKQRSRRTLPSDFLRDVTPEWRNMLRP